MGGRHGFAKETGDGVVAAAAVAVAAEGVAVAAAVVEDVAVALEKQQNTQAWSCHERVSKVQSDVGKAPLVGVFV